MTVTDDLLENNGRYAASFDKGDLPLPRVWAWPWWPAWTHVSIPTSCWGSGKATRT